MKYALIGIAVAGFAAAAWLPFRADLADAQARLAAGSRLAATACGLVEYAVEGEGPAVLLVHGSGGGYSQVAGFSTLLAGAGFEAVAMSRFGYLRTPLPADASAEAQADAHACLLDTLGIRRAAVIGASAGAPSALQFCIRHSDRCAAMILLVPAAHLPGRGATAAPSPLLQFVVDHVLSSDFVIWAVTRLAPGLLVKTALATPLADFRNASPGEQARALAMVRDIFPVSPKLAGLRNDAVVCSPTMPRYALESIGAPTLAISVADDLYGTYESARYTASQIPGARFVGFPAGGHVWLGHDGEVNAEIAGFLRANAR